MLNKELLFDICAKPNTSTPMSQLHRRAALYARVSTVDKGQDPETQLQQLRAYARRRGFAIAGEYVDFAGGSQPDRPQYQALFDAVRKHGGKPAN